MDTRVITLDEGRQIAIHRDGGVCVICCQGFDEVHHRYRRGMGGSKDPDIHSPVNLLCLCRHHHAEAESLRTDVAAPNGLCVPNLPEAFLSPVRTYLGWALPTVGGTWLPLCAHHQATDTAGARSIAYRLGVLPL